MALHNLLQTTPRRVLQSEGSNAFNSCTTAGETLGEGEDEDEEEEKDEDEDEEEDEDEDEDEEEEEEEAGAVDALNDCKESVGEPLEWENGIAEEGTGVAATASDAAG